MPAVKMSKVLHDALMHEEAGIRKKITGDRDKGNLFIAWIPRSFFAARTLQWRKSVACTAPFPRPQLVASFPGIQPRQYT